MLGRSRNRFWSDGGAPLAANLQRRVKRACPVDEVNAIKRGGNESLLSDRRGQAFLVILMQWDEHQRNGAAWWRESQAELKIGIFCSVSVWQWYNLIN